MKHTLKITSILIILFIVTQLAGLVTVNKHIQVSEPVNGTVIIVHPATIIGEPPVVENKSSSFIYILLGVLIGTALLMLFIKLKVKRVWKYWFLLSVFVTISVALGVYVNKWIALGIAAILAIWKVQKPNVYIHNLSEVFIYTGIAIIFLPILNLISATILLVLISIYDMYAVWKSKHMIKLAKFQTQSKVFAGLFIPYAEEGSKSKMKSKLPEDLKTKTKTKMVKVKSAILGGGDIAFPLIFSATVMEFLILDMGIAKTTSLLLSGIISITTAGALAFLFWAAKEDRFYPAMPFVSGGCFIGFGIVYLLVLL